MQQLMHAAQVIGAAETWRCCSTCTGAAGMSTNLTWDPSRRPDAGGAALARGCWAHKLQGLQAGATRQRSACLGSSRAAMQSLWAACNRTGLQGCTSCCAEWAAVPQLSAEEPSQQYKQGKAILERAKVVSELEYMAACPQPVSCESDSES